MGRMSFRQCPGRRRQANLTVSRWTWLEGSSHHVVLSFLEKQSGGERMLTWPLSQCEWIQKGTIAAFRIRSRCHAALACTALPTPGFIGRPIRERDAARPRWVGCPPR